MLDIPLQGPGLAEPLGSSVPLQPSARERVLLRARPNACLHPTHKYLSACVVPVTVLGTWGYFSDKNEFCPQGAPRLLGERSK